MEPLGARDDVINIDSLTRWNLTLLPEASERQNENEREQSPFTWRNDLNSKIILWYAPQYTAYILIIILYMYMSTS